MDETFLDDNNDYGVELTAKKETKLRKPDKNEGQLTIDVFQTDDEIVVQSAIAGANPEDIDISVTNDMVTIKGKRMTEHNIKSNDYFHQELFWGSFSRSVILPIDIDSDSAKASIKNGILTIRLPKLERIKTKKIKISD